MVKKLRSRGVKREHSIIQDLAPVLERIAAHPAVKSIIPGRISIAGSTISAVRLREQTATVTGLKLSARSRRSVQEVFVVTDDPASVREFLTTNVPEFDRP
ncbi:MAG TPA: DUF2103 domain-containing protein [Chloroflexota bacterium]|nr:DUF2103 domain-containing protein [Chloroflexota bacterium]